MVTTCVPLTPGTEERLNGLMSFQHWIVVAFFLVTRAGAMRYVVLDVGKVEGRGDTVDVGGVGDRADAKERAGRICK
jgi:hypothetical protein